MDNAVALVQAYLRLNGYLTVSEHPVIARAGAGYRTVTDLDVLAVRFPRMGQGSVGARDEDGDTPDPALDLAGNQVDMLIGEVKEGRAVLNDAATNPAVLEAALLRFGCCGSDEVERAVDLLMLRGAAELAHSHRVRLVSFGSIAAGGAPTRYTVITLGRVLNFLTSYVRRNWHVLRHTESKDPALGLLMLLEKIRQADAAGARAAIRPPAFAEGG